MQNSDMPAMPTSPNDNDPQWASARTGGLTKREHFAGLAMQGILANRQYEAPRRNKLEGMAVDAVSAADALLEELEK